MASEWYHRETTARSTLTDLVPQATGRQPLNPALGEFGVSEELFRTGEIPDVDRDVP